MPNVNPGVNQTHRLNRITGPEIAGDAMKYQGAPYNYGHATPAGWDCSGFINWVLGHDLGMKLPGQLTAGFTGQTHGPVVVSYVTWTKAATVLSPQMGDLCIWPGIGANGHIGIAVSPQKMISALSPGLGTIVTPISGSGPGGVPVMFRRVNGAGMPQGCLPLGMRNAGG